MLERWPEDEEDGYEQEGETEHRDQLERDEPLAEERPRVLPLVGEVDGGHEGRHRARRRPESEHDADDRQRDPGRRLAVEAVEAPAEEARRFSGYHAGEVPHYGRDRVRPHDEREGADRDEQDRRNREE